jgi:hypothetical protein
VVSPTFCPTPSRTALSVEFQIYNGKEPILKVEELKTTWPELSRRFGFAPIQHKKRSEHKLCESYCNKHIHDLVVARFNEDFERLSYSTEVKTNA